MIIKKVPTNQYRIEISLDELEAQQLLQDLHHIRYGESHYPDLHIVTHQLKVELEKRILNK